MLAHSFAATKYCLLLSLSMSGVGCLLPKGAKMPPSEGEFSCFPPAVSVMSYFQYPLSIQHPAPQLDSYSISEHPVHGHRTISTTASEPASFMPTPLSLGTAPSPSSASQSTRYTPSAMTHRRSSAPCAAALGCSRSINHHRLHPPPASYDNYPAQLRAESQDTTARAAVRHSNDQAGSYYRRD